MFSCEQLRRVKRDRDLAGHGLGQRDLCFGPRTRLGSVQPEDADHPVEDEDRSREHRERVEVEHALDPSELGVFQGGLRADVADGHRSPFAGREIRDRKPIVGSADRNEALRVPLGANRHRPARLAEPQEAALDAHGLAGLLDGDPQDGLQIELGSNLASDRRHQALPLERLGERARRAGAIEGERSLGGQGLEQRELLPVKTRRSRVVASTSTASTFSSETSGTKTALFAPTFSASRRLTRGEPAAS